jgi:hypothetical protein
VVCEGASAQSADGQAARQYRWSGWKATISGTIATSTPTTITLNSAGLECARRPG